jgi:Skp family chaperone for outer membrane proteins
MSHKRSRKSKWLKKKRERYEEYIRKKLAKIELKNIPKIFDYKEKEVIALEKGYYIDIEEGEVLYSPKHISPILKKLF